MGIEISQIVDNCSCTKSPSHEQLYNDFYAGMKIWTKPSKDINELIKSKRANIKEITDKKWLIITDNALLNPEQKETSIFFWQRALNFSKKFYNENILYLAILIMTEDDLTSFKKNFKDLILTVGQYKAVLTSESIQSRFVLKVVTLYIHLISKMAVSDLSGYSSNASEFEIIFDRAFGIDIQKKYIETILMKGYTGEWIIFDSFFDEKYTILRNHCEIRNSLIKLYNGIDILTS